MKMNYLFTSERLGFRNWTNNDLKPFAKINADKEVMQHLPKTLSFAETEKFITKLQLQLKQKKYTYFAVDVLQKNEFIGFIGLAYQNYESKLTPAVDIGWRLKKTAWQNGYATEGAKRCLQFAFEELNLEKIIATCTLKNKSSENVMMKIGMKKVGEFKHPRLKDKAIQICKWYQITKHNYLNL